MKKFIPVETSFEEWKDDPRYRAEYVALVEEFVSASALIEGSGNIAANQAKAAA